MQARDPIPQFKKWVLDEKILSEQQISDIDKDVEAVVEEAVQFADESPKPVRHLTAFASAELFCRPSFFQDSLGSGDTTHRQDMLFDIIIAAPHMSFPLTKCFGVLQEKGQLLENVFADPKGFGIAANGKYRYEQPGFGSGTADVS